MRTACLAFLFLCVLTAPVEAVPFRNLDFEEATIPPYLPGFHSAAPALIFPGWSVGSSGTCCTNYTLYNTMTVGSSAQILMGPVRDPAEAPYVFPPLQGLFSAVLMERPDPMIGTSALIQTGTVPADARSIRFRVATGIDEAAVTLSGVSIPLTNIGPGFIGGDISAFAGQDAQLMFTVRPGITAGALYFDDIQFSPIPVPEPSTIILLAAGFLVIAIRRRAFG
jgi:hypothetical protein